MTAPTLESYTLPRGARVGPEAYARFAKAAEDVLRDYFEEVAKRGIQPGTCFCKCGESTTPAPRSAFKDGMLIGFPQRFCRGHQNIGVSQQKPRDFDESYYTVKPMGYKTDCWVWNKALRDGYAMFRVNSVTQGVHRWTYEKFKGTIPEGFEVDHLCRVRSCVNPEHLEAVTKEENIRRGNSAKITAEIAREIRRLRSEGVQAPVIAKMFGIGTSNVYKVQYRTAWVDV